MGYFVWVCTFLLFVRAESYVLLTANVDDIHAIANQLASSPVVQQLKDIWRRASKSFNRHYKHFRAENSDSELDRSGSVERELRNPNPKDIQGQRRKALTNLVQLGRNASVYLKQMFSSL